MRHLLKTSLLMLGLIAHADLTLAAAGKVEFVHGVANIMDSSGDLREAAKGAEFDAGETLLTADGRMQVKFIDGGYISLQPNTSFKVEAYHYSGREDGSERGIFRLIKGGLRAITGVIGHANKPNYRMDTPVATIGIRGTEFTASLDDAQKLLVKVGDGAVFMENHAGNLVLYKGQAGEVSNMTSRPSYSEIMPVLVAAGPQQGTLQDTLEEKQATDTSENGFRNADIRSDFGAPCVLVACDVLSELEDTVDNTPTPTPTVPSPLPGGGGDAISSQILTANARNMTGTWSGTSDVSGRFLGILVTLAATGTLRVDFSNYQAGFSVNLRDWTTLVSLNTQKEAVGQLQSDGSFTFSDGRMSGSGCTFDCTLKVHWGQLSGDDLGKAGVNFSVRDLLNLIVVNNQTLNLDGRLMGAP